MNEWHETIGTYEDVLIMLDGFLKEKSKFVWDVFYSDRERGVPFFVNAPDENLVEYLRVGRLPPQGVALDLGCGPGRNAVYLAELGYAVDAVDLSVEALRWAEERAKERNVNVRFILDNLFDFEAGEAEYDLIYDSGCLHHIAPHRRPDYIKLLRKALKPGGFYAVVCFVENGPLGGAAISDWDVYRLGSLQGGLGFTPEKLKRIFKDFRPIRDPSHAGYEAAERPFRPFGSPDRSFPKAS